MTKEILNLKETGMTQKDREIKREKFETVAWTSEWQYGDYLKELVGVVYFQTIQTFADIAQYWGSEDPEIAYDLIYQLDDNNSCNGYHFDSYEDLIEQWQPISELIYEHTGVRCWIQNQEMFLFYQPREIRIVSKTSKLHQMIKNIRLTSAN